jgi:hypothetical protein
MLESLSVRSSFSVVLKIRKLSFWHRIDFRFQFGQAELFSTSVQPMLLALYSLIIGSMFSQQKSSIQVRIIDYRNL